VDREKADDGEPCAPDHHVVQVLQIQHTKYENELQKDEIPKLIFYVLDKNKTFWIKFECKFFKKMRDENYLIFKSSQLAEYYALDNFAEEDEATVAEVDQNPDAPGLVGDRSVGGAQVAVLLQIARVVFELVALEIIALYVV
jgi:hypothetical protein